MIRILIADDEIVSRRKMERLIRSLGYELFVAKDGEEALEIWKNKRPRMVITDWIMPGMNGVELCREIRASEGSLYT